jgi:UDP-N-acetylglucosamine 3-dehydrogenase
MKKINIGIIGAGFWGSRQARAISEIKNANLVAICDADESRAREIGEKYRIKWHTNLSEMLRKNELNAVTICTPTTTHAKLAEEVIMAGKAVLVEKPMTTTVEEARHLIDLAKKQNVMMTVGYIERFNPAVNYLKTLITNKKLGKIILIEAKRVSRWPERVGDVGVIKDTATHDIDITRYLLGEDPLNVYAKVGSLRHKYEDYADILLGYSHNRAAFIEANWLTPHKVRTLTVIGSEAMVTLDYITQEIWVEDSEKTIKPSIIWQEPLLLELKHFVECVIENKKPLVTGEDGLAALKIADAILESAKKGKPVFIKS